MLLLLGYYQFEALKRGKVEVQFVRKLIFVSHSHLAKYRRFGIESWVSSQSVDI